MSGPPRGPRRTGDLGGRLVAALALLFVIVWVSPLRHAVFGGTGDPGEDLGDALAARHRLVAQLDVAVARSDGRLLVHTLEQLAAAELQLGDPGACIEHVERALAVDAALDPADSRRAALLDLRARARAAPGRNAAATEQR